jgi:alpha-tubulin suppressor-like RCC1 family protein
MPTGSKVASVSCGFNHTCLTTTAGDICTFGYGIYGQLGYGYRDNVEAPLLVAGPSFPEAAPAAK